MSQSEYRTQADINRGLNQLHGMDGAEGSSALSQANKPEVDWTEAQKVQILAAADDKQATANLLISENGRKIGSRPINSVASTKHGNYKTN